MLKKVYINIYHCLLDVYGDRTVNLKAARWWIMCFHNGNSNMTSYVWPSHKSTKWRGTWSAHPQKSGQWTLSVLCRSWSPPLVHILIRFLSSPMVVTMYKDSFVTENLFYPSVKICRRHYFLRVMYIHIYRCIYPTPPIIKS